MLDVNSLLPAVKKHYANLSSWLGVKIVNDLNSIYLSSVLSKRDREYLCTFPFLLYRLLGKEIITIREAAWLTDNTYKYEDVVRMMGEITATLSGKFRVSSIENYNHGWNLKKYWITDFLSEDDAVESS